MRWMDKPEASAASMPSFHGSHKLFEPAPLSCNEPVRGLPGDFESRAGSEPVCGVGDFGFCGPSRFAGWWGILNRPPPHLRVAAARCADVGAPSLRGPSVRFLNWPP